MQIQLTKVHGSENDFFILDETLLERRLIEEELIQLTKVLTNRQTGLLNGADGVLLVGATDHPEATAKMRVINNDGSEASMCGNGLRTVARYLSEKNKLDYFKVETLHADLVVQTAEEIGKNVATFQVEISPVSLHTSTLPLNIAEDTMINQPFPELAEGLLFSAVAVPNPHLISFVDHETLNGPLLEKIAMFVNGKNPYFPDGVNVSFVEVLGKNQIFVRTYERGVGFTNACGTAMSASSLMYVLLKDGEFDKKISVYNPGGMVQTLVHQDQEDNYWMELIGNATFVQKLELSLEDGLAGEFSDVEVQMLNENDAYQEFVKVVQESLVHTD
ncbi:diaminopimelate epimerase [Carnobacterium gallinarum]|uniref:diaminopimelate epimerase n=1 Tax=Carnobacterium gallinarum TaxID=2749 RepID=UPI00054D5A5D|nr:diaminopimelate epimerase [Carnobacterium gallinarum]